MNKTKADTPSHIITTLVVIVISTVLGYLAKTIPSEHISMGESLSWIILLVYPGATYSMIVIYCTSTTSPRGNKIIFLVLSCLLYAAVFFFSLASWGLGAFVLPSLGAVLMLRFHGRLFGIEYSRKTILLSALSGPISGGIMMFCFAVTRSAEEGMPAAIAAPIIAWWIYMSMLLDYSTEPKC